MSVKSGSNEKDDMLFENGEKSKVNDSINEDE